MKKVNKVLGIAFVAFIFAFVLGIIAPQVNATESPDYVYVNIDESMTPVIKQGYTYEDYKYGVMSLDDEYKLTISLTTNIKDYTLFDLKYGLSEVNTNSNIVSEIRSNSQSSDKYSSTFYIPVKYISTEEVTVDEDKKIKYNGELYVHTFVVEFNEITFRKMNIDLGTEVRSKLFRSKIFATLGSEYIVDGSLTKVSYYRFSHKYYTDNDAYPVYSQDSKEGSSGDILQSMNTNVILSVKSGSLSPPVIVSQNMDSEKVNSMRAKLNNDVFIEEIDIKNILVSTENNSVKNTYIVGKNGPNKLKDVSQVFSEQDIDPNKIVDSVELVNVNDAPKYVFSVKEKRMLFGFIPLGTRTVTKSIDATESLDSQ